MNRAASALVIALILLVACTKLPESDIPTNLPNPTVPPLPTPNPTAPLPSPALPSPSPSNPGPVPTTTTTLPPAGSCSLPSLPDGSPCSKEGATFGEQVAAAQEQVRNTRPDLFNGTKVKDETAYVQEVARVLRVSFGLCAAQGGPPDEVAVKNTNAFNDQYDIVTGNLDTWTNYTVTCRPARF